MIGDVDWGSEDEAARRDHREDGKDDPAAVGLLLSPFLARLTLLRQHLAMALVVEAIDLDPVEARQGVETGTVRWVLRISLGLAVIAGFVIYFSFFGH